MIGLARDINSMIDPAQVTSNTLLPNKDTSKATNRATKVVTSRDRLRVIPSSLSTEDINKVHRLLVPDTIRDLPPMDLDITKGLLHQDPMARDHPLLTDMAKAPHLAVPAMVTSSLLILPSNPIIREVEAVVDSPVQATVR